MALKPVIIYCSPAGTTRHVADVFEDSLKRSGFDVFVLDLGTRQNHDPVLSKIKEADQDLCLFIGSPVYVSHALPPVMNFISNLPELNGASAVPFVTWGGASSGIALYEMGKALKEKGFDLAGAAKVIAVHCMMWRSDNPLGQGRPNSEDDNMIQNLVSQICEKTDLKQGIDLSVLAYQTKAAHAEMEKVSLEKAKGHMPKREIDENLCTQCNICSDVCPADAISFSPYPEFGSQCISCFNCVKQCPEQAIIADLSQLEGRIRQRSEQFKEQPLSCIYI
ncbi:4Fe-4S ferredoxin iron-sulfur binding domain-containing protein [Desulfonema limicola]|uniref:4Fe-4S ferredoxin iron-sulfur binding domain-containing protein n=1 Tax=Desulfonema limicola TaxID=45656 RepID=A0A975BB84_9BACT|nr:EFR1 family ferrodoxin [Desulfonema limicola]QTA82112.1 4Fe-4S ferredoxin iron-sulfur binding domain-containing protein [Desulfonema limicola]